MSREGRLTSFNAWVVVGTSLTVAFALVVAIGAFIILPYAQTNLRARNVWDTICSAAGVPRTPPPEFPVQAAFKTSTVVMASERGDPGAVSIGRGATLSLRCAICHDTSGADQATVPALEGQYADVIDKELEDFKSGARENTIMGPFAATLSKRDIFDLAAYYSQLSGHSDRSATAVPSIVAKGAPMRGIAPCGACHGGSAGPRLTDQPAVYLKSQLEAFKTGRRHNDISQRMRNVARDMTSAEIDATVHYYQKQTPDGLQLR